MKLTVNEILEKFGELPFITDPEDILNLKAYFKYSPVLDKYDSFFVSKEDDQYVLLFGMVGRIPYLHKEVYDVLDMIESGVILPEDYEIVLTRQGVPTQYLSPGEAGKALSNIKQSEDYCTVFVSKRTAIDHKLPGSGWYIRKKSSIDYFIPANEKVFEHDKIPIDFQQKIKRSDIEIYQHDRTNEILIKIIHPAPYHKLLAADVLYLCRRGIL